MHKLHSLKEKLVKELNEYGDRTSFSPSDIQTIKNLISSINKICDYTDAMEDEEYSGRMYHDEGRSMRGRRRDAMGRYSRDEYSRDEYSRGYSRNDDLMDKLYDAMESAPEHQRAEIKRMIDKMNK